MEKIPSVLAILVCDWIIIEQGTEKKTLVGLFDRIQSRKFPTQRPIGLSNRHGGTISAGHTTRSA